MSSNVPLCGMCELLFPTWGRDCATLRALFVQRGGRGLCGLKRGCSDCLSTPRNNYGEYREDEVRGYVVFVVFAFKRKVKVDCGRPEETLDSFMLVPF